MPDNPKAASGSFAPLAIPVFAVLWAATVLGIVGAGGLGLEIVTAFHLFEYREAMALILVLLGLVTVINLAGDRLRAWFVSHEQ